MKTPEYEKPFISTDDGFSEKKLALDTEKGTLRGNKTSKILSIFEKKRKK